MIDKRLVGWLVGCAALFGLLCCLTGCAGFSEFLGGFTSGALEGGVGAVANDPTPGADGYADILGYIIAAVVGGLSSGVPAYRAGLKKKTPPQA